MSDISSRLIDKNESLNSYLDEVIFKILSQFFHALQSSLKLNFFLIENSVDVIALKAFNMA